MCVSVLCKVNDMDAATSVRLDASSVLGGCGAEKKSSSPRGKCWSENRAAINDSCSIMLNVEFCVFPVFLWCRCCCFFVLLFHRAKWALFSEYWTLIITHIIDSELSSMFLGILHIEHFAIVVFYLMETERQLKLMEHKQCSYQLLFWTNSTLHFFITLYNQLRAWMKGCDWCCDVSTLSQCEWSRHTHNSSEFNSLQLPLLSIHDFFHSSRWRWKLQKQGYKSSKWQ